MSGRLVNNEHRNIWRGDTVQERTASMVASYTVNTIGESDTLVVLTDRTQLKTCYQEIPESPVLRCFPRCNTDMTVAQISDCGYVDFFRGLVSEYRQDEYSEHFCVYPSEVEKLFAAYQEWKAKNERKEIAREYGYPSVLVRAMRSENV